MQPVSAYDAYHKILKENGLSSERLQSAITGADGADEVEQIKRTKEQIEREFSGRIFFTKHASPPPSFGFLPQHYIYLFHIA